jgi:enolase
VTTRIALVHGRRVWDSRARPTVEVEIALDGGATGRAIAPAGASTGSGEAVDLRDGGDAFGGLDVRQAVAGVNREVAPALAGVDAADQAEVDRRLIALDGTPGKSRLGGNALIATSMAAAHAAAAGRGIPLWRHLAGDAAPGCLPLPEIQIFGGGAHAGRRIDIQDFLVIAVGAPDYETALDWTARVYHAAGRLMSDAGMLQGVADEGGFWPAFASNRDALDMLVRAIEAAGLSPGRDMAVSLDIAASDFGRGGRYRLGREGRELDSAGLIEMLLDWCARYPVVSIEDPLGEDDPEGMAAFTRAVGPGVQVVGDDFVVTNAERIAAAAEQDACNAALIKPNQIGTLSEARKAADTASEVGWGRIASARSGESEDVTIVHLAVGWAIPQLKVGSIARSERNAKWNEGLRLADVLPAGAGLPPRDAFPWNRS